MTVVIPTPAGIDAALMSAGHEVLVASTQGTVGALRRVDQNLRRGVRYRILMPDHVRDQPALAVRLGRLAAAGADVRTLPEVPTDATVIDAAVALLAYGRPGDVTLFALPSVVTAVIALFDRLWAAAAPLTASDMARGAGLSERERELLGLLSGGCTDESAAARLGVSVRTVRRMMSGIMNRLGARSRFQAGLRAADRGLLVQPVP